MGTIVEALAMADLGVIHADIDAGGGAEAVGLHTLSALDDAGHDVTLYTTDEPDIQTLADSYGVTLSGAISVVPVRTLSVAAANHAASLATPLGVTDFPLLRTAILERVVKRRHAHTHDCLFCTHGEFRIDGAIEYVHFPYFSPVAMRRYDTRFTEPLYPPYHRICRTIKHRDDEAETLTLTNSAWTANVIRETLGREATVVYPPVAVDAFDPPSWENQERGFVAVGRLHPLKRQWDLVTVVARLRERGFDTHLHLIGGDGRDEYATQLRKRASRCEWLNVEGHVSRYRLVSMLERHRYALHGRRHEHFGIAVAEAVAAGSLPFVHASGGQREVVVGQSELQYTDMANAVEQTAKVLDSPEAQRRLRNSLSGSEQRFDGDRFQKRVCEIIESNLE